MTWTYRSLLEISARASASSSSGLKQSARLFMTWSNDGPSENSERPEENAEFSESAQRAARSLRRCSRPKDCTGRTDHGQTRQEGRTRHGRQQRHRIRHGEALFDRAFDINVKGTLFTIQKALPLLTEGASIILTSSIVGSKGFAQRSVYSATKAALRSFARTWTMDLKDRKIRVNVVSPGAIDTPGLQGLSKKDSEGLDELFRGRIPLGRVGLPDDVASAVSFLASDESSYISGIELFVDGGLAQV